MMVWRPGPHNHSVEPLQNPPNTRHRLCSSKKASIGVWWIPVIDFGPWHSGFADFTNIVVARANRMTVMVEPAPI